jgi:Arc/MetJ-type ribon-helix-helix transcriptional regulator
MAVKQKNVKIRIAAPYQEGITLLIEDGLYETQTEVIKDALRRLLKHYEIPMIPEPETFITAQ